MAAPLACAFGRAACGPVKSGRPGALPGPAHAPKVTVFSTAVNAGLGWLAVVMAVNVVIALY
ncbi:hypothetical protein, partial [Streptomyces sp. NPDC003688]